MCAALCPQKYTKYTYTYDHALQHRTNISFRNSKPTDYTACLNALLPYSEGIKQRTDELQWWKDSNWRVPTWGQETLRDSFLAERPSGYSVAHKNVEKIEKWKDIQGKCQSLWNIWEHYDLEIATEKLESEVKLREWCYVLSQNEKACNLEVLGRNIPWINFYLQTEFYFQDRRKRDTVN